MGVSQAIPWTGATTSVNFNNNRQDSTSNNATINPNYTANLQFSATQPLLRNRSIDSNRQSIQTTQITRGLADVTLKATLTNTVAATRGAYRDLVYTIQAVGVGQAVARAGAGWPRHQTRGKSEPWRRLTWCPRRPRSPTGSRRSWPPNHQADRGLALKRYSSALTDTDVGIDDQSG
jgi:hypothetical protein